jgi:hypothetical protein
MHGQSGFGKQFGIRVVVVVLPSLPVTAKWDKARLPKKTSISR